MNTALQILDILLDSIILVLLLRFAKHLKGVGSNLKEGLSSIYSKIGIIKSSPTRNLVKEIKGHQDSLIRKIFKNNTSLRSFIKKGTGKDHGNSI